MDSVVKRIKFLAQVNNMTLKELGIKSGVGETSIYRWDRQQPTIRSLQKVAEVLNVDYRKLLP